MLVELPLMPLNAVLFPGMPMPLVVFEERYLQMVRRCREADRPFGVALIREGQEVGGPAVPHEVGTTASIVAVESLEGHALQVMAVGQERFRLVALAQAEPYLVGQVEILEEDSAASAPHELYTELRELFGDYLRVVLELLGQPNAEMTLPDNPVKLSYMIAAHLTSPLEVRQQLLEMDSLRERLFYEKLLLKREDADYRLILSARHRYDEFMQSLGDAPDASVFSAN